MLSTNSADGPTPGSPGRSVMGASPPHTTRTPVHALPVRRPSSHRPESQPPEPAPRALVPAVLLWLAGMVALVAPASLAPALAGSSTVSAADPVSQASTSASPAAAPAGTSPAADPAGTRPARGFAGAKAAGLASGGIRPARTATAPRVPALRPPVDGPLVRGFEEAAGPFGPGHRGVDFGAVPGLPVRAPAVLVTLGPLRTLEASVGQATTTGDRLGTLASGHASPDPSVAALHLGLRVHGTYIDPLPWLAGLARPRLAPLSEPGGPH